MSWKGIYPGSEEALKLGCTCPVMDNQHGRGSHYGNGTYILNADCPVHCPPDHEEMPKIQGIQWRADSK